MSPFWRRLLFALALALGVARPNVASTSPSTPTWRMFGLPGNVYDAPAIDLVHRRQYLITGAESTDSVLCVWSADLDHPEPWKLMETREPQPRLNPFQLYTLRFSAMDSKRGRLILSLMDENRTRILSLDSMTWTEVEPDLSYPYVRDGVESAIDPVEDRLYLFGGDVRFKEFPIPAGPPAPFLLPSLARSALAPPYDASNGRPQGLHDPAFAYDARRRQFWVHGGQRYQRFAPNGELVEVDDLWRFDLDTGRWTLLANGTSAPSARYLHHMMVDSLNDRLLLWRGTSFNGTSPVALEDWWQLALPADGTATWQRFLPVNAIPRAMDVGVFDPVRRVFSFAGGSGPARGGRFELNIDGTPVWTTVVPDRPDPPNGRRLFVDPASQRAILVTAGALYTTPVQQDPDWTVRPTLGNAPELCAFVRDPLRDRILAVGGLGGAGALDTVLVVGTNGGAWTGLPVQGPRPGRRYDASAVYDASRDRVLLFGGRAPDVSGQPRYLGDLWALSLSGAPAWTQLDAGSATVPLGRQRAAVVLDSLADRVVVWGGMRGTSPMNDVKEFSLATGQWSTLAPAGSAPVWQDRFAAWDSRRRKLWVLAHEPFGQRSLLYTLSLAGPPAWELAELQGSGPRLPLPNGISEVTGDYDAVHDRIVLQRPAPGQSVLWVLQMFDWRKPTEPLLQTASTDTSSVDLTWWVGRDFVGITTLERRDATSDWIDVSTLVADAEGFVHYAGQVPALGQNFAFRLRLNTADAVVWSPLISLAFPFAPRPVVDVAELRSADPVTGPLHIDFSIPTGIPEAELGIYDLHGRVLWRRTFNGDGRQYHIDIDGVRPRPGLYFALLRTWNRRLISRRITILR